VKDIFWLTEYASEHTGLNLDAGGLKRLLDHLVYAGTLPQSRAFEYRFHGTVDVRVKAVIEALKTPEGREATKPRTVEAYPVEERLSKLKFSEPIPLEVAEWEGLPPVPPAKRKRTPRKPKP